MTPMVAALPTEQALFVLAARIELSSGDKIEMEKLLIREPDWEHIRNLTSTLGISALFYKHICDNGFDHYIPGHVLAYLDSEYRRISIKNIRIYSQLDEILTRTGQAGIPIIGLKGIFLAKYLYQDIGLRQMEDIDLMCKISDLTEFCRILCDLGYHQKLIVFRSKAHEQIYINENDHLPPFILDAHASVEVHYRLFGDSNAQHCFDPAKIWADAGSIGCSGQVLFALSLENQLLHLLVHLHTHFYKSERIFPLYWFCDIHEWINRYHRQIEWDRFLFKSRQLDVENQISGILDIMVSCWATRLPEPIWSYISDLNIKKEKAGQKDNRLALKNFFHRDTIKNFSRQKRTYLQRTYLQRSLEAINTEKKVRGNVAAIYLLLNFFFPSREYLIREHQLKNPRTVVFYRLIHPLKIFQKSLISFALNVKQKMW